MSAAADRDEDREQARERPNALRVVGGLMLIMALLAYFFHLAEAPMGRHVFAVLAACFAAAGAVLLWVGWYRMRALR